MEIDEKYRVGILEEENDWIEVFKRKLKDDFDLVIFDLNTIETKEQMLEAISSEELDCIIADFELNEAQNVPFRGDEIIDEYREKFPFFPVFIISSKDQEDILPLIHDNEIVRDKDELMNNSTILIQRIQNKIKNYKDAIEDAEKQIAEIQDRRQKGEELTLADEENLYENYLFLDKIYPDQKVLPENWVNKDSITKLSDFLKDTKEIIDQLKQLNNA